MIMAFDGGASAQRGAHFLDVHFSGLDLDAAVDAVSARASLGARFAYVTTPNVDHIVGLSREPGRRALYDAAWLTLNDSRILQSLGARAALDLPVAPGSDLAQRLFDDVIDRREPITIIGGDEEMIEALKRRYYLTDVRWHRAPAGLKNKPAAIVRAAAFAASQPSRFVFICVGAPQQEMVAYAIAQHPDAVGVGLCVGAALEFVTGQKERAPRWMRAVGLEWFHRLTSEPQRLWRRYLVDGPKVFSLFATWRASIAA